MCECVCVCVCVCVCLLACGSFWFYEINYITLQGKNNFKKSVNISPSLYVYHSTGDLNKSFTFC